MTGRATDLHLSRFLAHFLLKFQREFVAVINIYTDFGSVTSVVKLPVKVHFFCLRMETNLKKQYFLSVAVSTCKTITIYVKTQNLSKLSICAERCCYLWMRYELRRQK